MVTRTTRDRDTVLMGNGFDKHLQSDSLPWDRSQHFHRVINGMSLLALPSRVLFLLRRYCTTNAILVYPITTINEPNRERERNGYTQIQLGLEMGRNNNNNKLQL